MSKARSQVQCRFVCASGGSNACLFSHRTPACFFERLLVWMPVKLFWAMLMVRSRQTSSALILYDAGIVQDSASHGQWVASVWQTVGRSKTRVIAVQAGSVFHGWSA